MSTDSNGRPRGGGEETMSSSGAKRATKEIPTEQMGKGGDGETIVRRKRVRRVKRRRLEDNGPKMWTSMEDFVRYLVVVKRSRYPPGVVPHLSPRSSTRAIVGPWVRLTLLGRVVSVG